jgi:hypothetical protein
MFITLLAVTLIVAVVASVMIAVLFDKPVGRIFRRIVSDDLGPAWHRYVRFAIFVVGISGGVRIRELEKYVTPRELGGQSIDLNAERWTLEVYRTIIETTQSVAWMLLVFFLFALLAYVIVRGSDLRHAAARSN